MRVFLVLFSFLFVTSGFCQAYLKNETLSYDDLISNYQRLDQDYDNASLIEIGKSDFGKAIHLFIIHSEKIETLEELSESKKVKILINNGIHPGEACGIDASLELAKDLLQGKQNVDLNNVIIAIIPVLNVGGMHNRSGFSRANQNGPREYGFRGNAKNLDLNRDFIKCDSKNIVSFISAFQLLDPDIFVDTHTTNGSDHQYTLTLISSQKDKMNPVLSAYNEKEFLPELYTKMAQRGFEMTPYVYPIKGNPENGLHDFLETPRYSSGYASLFNCLSYITEAHVFKPFKDRVIQTKAFLYELINLASKNTERIKKVRSDAFNYDLNRNEFSLAWQLDTLVSDTIQFKGYETETRISNVTNQEMIYYNKDKPYTKKLPYYGLYTATKKVNKPLFYLIPQAYEKVIQLFDLHHVKYRQLQNDSTVFVNFYYIDDFRTLKSPFEGHYLHYNISVLKQKDSLKFYKGDYLIPIQQSKVRYLIETLEPESVDGFFAWNFFDAVLQQKEWFSPYAFDPKADSILKSSPDLKKRFDKKKKEEKDFSENNFAQLYFIYKNSDFFEKTAFRNPVYRIE